MDNITAINIIEGFEEPEYPGQEYDCIDFLYQNGTLQALANSQGFWSGLLIQYEQTI